jgi:ribulose-5-phosphate 4-epimerase/fuculose-1-phosphate aldolase
MTTTEKRLTVESATRRHDRPVFESVEAERIYRKQRLAAAFRIFAQYDFDLGFAGHISARDPELDDHFWINPLDIPFAHVRVSDLQLVNFDGEIVHGEGPINPAGFAIHSQILLHNPEVVSAAHSHSVHGVAWSTFGRLLDPISQDACEFYGSHALLNEYHGAVLDLSEGKAIADLVGENKFIILKNHGLLSLGHSVEEAARYFIVADRCCHVQLLADAAGEPDLIDLSIAEKMGRPRPYAGFSFAAYYDRIVRQEPDLLE